MTAGRNSQINNARFCYSGIAHAAVSGLSLFPSSDLSSFELSVSGNIADYFYFLN